MRKWTMMVAACAAATAVGVWAMEAAPVADSEVVQRDAAARVVDTSMAEAEAAQVQATVAELDAKVARQDKALNVGDADSFGKPVRWLGFASVRDVQIRRDCTPLPQDPVDMRCLQVTEVGSASGEFRNLASITLPGRSTESLLCHWLSPSLGGSFYNGTGIDNREMSLALYPSMTLESEVLADPSLIDPVSGQPMNGKLELAGTSTRMTLLLDAGERLNQQQATTRACIGGYITRRSLVEYYGLSEKQARQLFAKPMTLRLNMRIISFGLASGYASYGIRFVGD